MSKERPEEVVIVDVRFFRYGEAVPESRFDGSVTATSLIGYSEYTNAETREQCEKVIGLREDGYLGYTNKNEDGMTFSSLGTVNKNKRTELKSQIKEAFDKPGKVAWELILSLPSYEFAHESGFDINEDYASLAYKTMPKVFSAMGLKPNNIIWWGDHHSDTSHPHMHLVFMEKQQTRKHGQVKAKEMKKIKTLFNEEIIARREFERKIQKDFKGFMQDKDDDFHNIISSVKSIDFPTHPQIKDLKKVLPKTGRLQYNSKNMLPYKKMLDSIITDMLNSEEIKPLFDMYVKKLDLLEENMNSIARSEISAIKSAEIKKLYKQIGNVILDSYKDNTIEEAQTYHQNNIPQTPLNKEESIIKVYTEIGNQILDNYDKKVKTGYFRNGQQIREPYSEKHLRRDCKRIITDNLMQQLNDLQEWERENGILFE